MINLTLEIKEQKLADKNWNVLKTYKNGNLICQEVIKTDDIEDLELQLIRMTKKLYKYRKSLESTE